MKRQYKKTLGGITACEFDLVLNHSFVELEYCRTLPDYRGKGFASELLEKSKQFSVNLNLPLIAFVDPDKSGGLNFEQETQWLIRHGFKSVKRFDFGGYYKPVMAFNL